MKHPLLATWLLLAAGPALARSPAPSVTVQFDIFLATYNAHAPVPPDPLWSRQFAGGRIMAVNAKYTSYADERRRIGRLSAQMANDPLQFWCMSFETQISDCLKQHRNRKPTPEQMARMRARIQGLSDANEAERKRHEDYGTRVVVEHKPLGSPGFERIGSYLSFFIPPGFAYPLEQLDRFDFKQLDKIPPPQPAWPATPVTGALEIVGSGTIIVWEPAAFKGLVLVQARSGIGGPESKRVDDALKRERWPKDPPPP